MCSLDSSRLAKYAPWLLTVLVFFLSFGQTNTIIERRETERVIRGLEAEAEALRERVDSVESAAETLSDEVHGEATATAPRVSVVPAGRRPSPTPETPSSPKPGPVPRVPGVTEESPANVAMTVDKTVASPGETLTYKVTVFNPDSERHFFRTLTHIPEGTRFVDSPDCSRLTCPIFKNGSNTRHQLAYSDVVPARGAVTYTFTVVILRQALNTVISNHAHTEDTSGTRYTSDSTRTAVKPPE